MQYAQAYQGREQVSDYTPTTETVRDAFCESYADHLFGFKREEFDRWLESIMQKAHIAERERIIKLIQSETSLHAFAFRDSGVPLSTHLIARIKGENK
jgi:hypothetical protein